MFSDLIRRPVIVAPMAGGPSTIDLVVAAAAAGAAGFVAAGYKSASAMRAEIDAVRAATAEPFGVNLFVPGRPTGDSLAVTSYVASLSADAARVGAAVGEPAWDDDGWAAKIADLIADPVPIVSFTFGCPDPEIMSGLRAAGSSLWVTVTDPAEARTAIAAGADCLCVQGPEAGAHRGTFTNEASGPGAPGADGTAAGGHRAGAPAPSGVLDLIRAVRQLTDLPVVAAGGIMDAAGAAAAHAAGAVAVQCGTAFLRCQESGAHPVHKAALADPHFTATALTRAFSGRPARGLVNQFMLDHQDAPAAYPEVNNATRPLRAAAAAAGDAQRMSLWAGQGYRAALAAPAGEVIDLLCGPGT